MFLSILNTKLLGLISLFTFLVTVLWYPPKVLVSVAAILELLLFSRASLGGWLGGTLLFNYPGWEELEYLRTLLA